VLRRWPAASVQNLEDLPSLLAQLPIDHSVAKLPDLGGQQQAQKRWRDFLWERLDRYGDDRNHPDRPGASGLSADLHFGTLSAHQVVTELLQKEDWSPGRCGRKADGKREGWWGLNPSAEAFLDQVITWRELGFNACSHRADYQRFSSLPDWARATLRTHESDPREHIYSRHQLENSATHDAIWNAAQRQLRREGRIHNYLRMLWGKKILQWSRTPRQALATMIHLNNKYALDGRDPNSYSGIFCVLGRYDRPWGPERPIFGTVRFMNSKNTARKLALRNYLETYGSESSQAARK
jgi:deoxyribodipyrimidine photo-lyase